MPPSNDILAECYKRDLPQAIVIFPLLWHHEAGGDWHVKHVFPDPNEGTIFTVRAA